MNTNDQNTLLDQELELSMKWIEPFNDLLDEIYYPGYAETLAEECPEQYQTEYFYFITLYS